MLLAIDVHYKENNTAKIVGLLFQNWQDESPKEVYILEKNDIEPYISGEFYKRELPCIAAIAKIIPNFEAVTHIIIDGYVFLDNSKKRGLGYYVYDFFEQKKIIIGVAKTSFFNNEENVVQVFRGNSERPLFVSAIGQDLDLAKHQVAGMHGNFRMPTLLKSLDTLTKS